VAGAFWCWRRFAPEALTWENHTGVVLLVEVAMTPGLAEGQGRPGNLAVQRCEAALAERSVYRLVPAEGTGWSLMSCSTSCTCTMAAA
jgi:hypothetical protein